MNTVNIIDNTFSDFNQLLQLNKNRWSKVFILVDSNTHEFCLSEFIRNADLDEGLEILEIDPGEASKDIEIATSLWHSLIELNADRKALLINLGGGVVCDLGGWVAANYKRGIDFIHVPTTVLAMVDASIGGKTGIDLGGVKNVIGSFTEPLTTFTYTPFLSTLEQKEWVSGYAEMLKHALISSKDLWSLFEAISPEDHDNIESLIPLARDVKKEIVSVDFKENGLRKSLNYGHTIGHAIESVSIEKYNGISHGHAIAIGMVLANIISVNKSILKTVQCKQINDYLLSIYTTPSWLNHEKELVFEKMQHDKKNVGTDLRMVLLKEIGEVVIDVETSIVEVENAIDLLEKDFIK